MRKCFYSAGSWHVLLSLLARTTPARVISCPCPGLLSQEPRGTNTRNVTSAASFSSSPGIPVLQEGTCLGTVLPAPALLILLAMTEV